MAPRVLIACDKFKGSATSAEISAALARGLGSAAEVDSVGVADGGDGTLAVALGAGYQSATVQAVRADGRRSEAPICWDPGSRTTVIESASLCGLAMLCDASGHLPPDWDASAATSAGIGDAVRAALSLGAVRIVIGLGGSATTDGGFGMALALGVRFSDASGTPVVSPERLGAVAGVDLSGLDPALAEVEWTIAADVESPLAGPDGAAAVFGPQKGLSPEAVPVRDAELARFGRLVEEATGRRGTAERPGSGAAGGLGFMGRALLGGQLVSGTDVVLDIVGFDQRLAEADLVVTGEGRIDRQTLQGKAPAGVAARARRAGLPVVAVCGDNALGQDGPGPFDAVHALTDLEPDAGRCMREPLPLLERVGALLAKELPDLLSGRSSA